MDLPKKGTRDYALADVLSRLNSRNGTYQRLGLPLTYEFLHNKNPLIITHVADIADQEIAEAVKQGLDLSDPKVKSKIQAAFFGGGTGATVALNVHRVLRFFGLRK